MYDKQIPKKYEVVMHYAYWTPESVATRCVLRAMNTGKLTSTCVCGRWFIST